MKFFHLSNTKYEGKIPPTVGPSRHGAEDPRAVGKAAVWLSNEPQIRSDHPTYQYEVELDLSDPDLFEDELFKQGIEEMNKLFGRSSTLGWFFYLRDAPIAVTRIWDATIEAYVLA